MQTLNNKVDNTAGVLGTLPANEWNETASETQNVITSSGQTLSSGDLSQLVKAIALYASNGDFYTDSGAANSYVLSTVADRVAPISYADGFRVSFYPVQPNTTGVSTVNVASIGVKNLIRITGENPEAGDLVGLVSARYSANEDAFILTSSVNTNQFILVDQAQNNMPIFPDVQNDDGLISITSPSTGLVRIPSGITFSHRGMFPVVTAQQDFATIANSTYHLRWTLDSGYELKSLADIAYNPSALDEIDTAFDTTYDDMIISRVVTDNSNVATITNLKNKSVLSDSFELSLIANASINWSVLSGSSVNIGWSRSPNAKPSLQLMRSESSEEGGLLQFQIGALGVRAGAIPTTRYELSDVEYQYQDSTSDNGRIQFCWNIQV